MVFHIFFSNSLLDSSHGASHVTNEGMTPLDQQYQFFGDLRFPVEEDIEAWTEKVSFLIMLTVLHYISHFVTPHFLTIQYQAEVNS